MYSQNAEEQYILEYFAGFKGSFADIGANDGVTLSNTCALAESGWSGVYVEPSPKAFAKLKENIDSITKSARLIDAPIGKLYAYNFMLGTTNDKAFPFHESGSHLTANDVGLLSTASEADRAKWAGSTQFEAITVQCFRWKTFLNRLAITKFDFISIDAEGMDLEILKQIDLTETQAVCIEWNSDPLRKEQYDAVLKDFRIIYTSTENLLYVR